MADELLLAVELDLALGVLRLNVGLPWSGGHLWRCCAVCTTRRCSDEVVVVLHLFHFLFLFQLLLLLGLLHRSLVVTDQDVEAEGIRAWHHSHQARPHNWLCEAGYPLALDRAVYDRRRWYGRLIPGLYDAIVDDVLGGTIGFIMFMDSFHSLIFWQVLAVVEFLGGILGHVRKWRLIVQDWRSDMSHGEKNALG